MKIHQTSLKDVFIIEPAVFSDSRGHFLEVFNTDKYHQIGIAANFVQDNQSISKKGVLRGLHGQFPHWQAKLVRVVKGRVIDVAVDVRKKSPNFGKWTSAELSEDNYKQMFIPKGFLHGFCVLSDTAVFEYKCDEYYYPAEEVAVRWDDPQISVNWPVKEPIISDKDAVAPLLSEVMDKLPD